MIKNAFFKTLFVIFFVHNLSISAKTSVILIPSTGGAHLKRHEETHNFYKRMWECCQELGYDLEVLKDWHNPAVIKDYVHFRLNKACGSGKVDNVDAVRKAKVLLHAAVPDQVESSLKSGWRPDHRILAAQYLAFLVLDKVAQGDDVTLVGLGIGGGQIAAGATRLLADEHTSRSFSDILNQVGQGIEAISPFFGPYSGFVKLGAQATQFAAHAARVLHNDAFLWQASKMPVDAYKQYLLGSKNNAKKYVHKLYTLGVPVSKETFIPDTTAIKYFYNLYSNEDLKCIFLGRKHDGNPGIDCKYANLKVKVDRALLPSGPATHHTLLNNKAVAKGILAIHENIENPGDFKFDVPGKIIFSKEGKPKYKRGKDSRSEELEMQTSDDNEDESDLVDPDPTPEEN